MQPLGMPMKPYSYQQRAITILSRKYPGFVGQWKLLRRGYVIYEADGRLYLNYSKAYDSWRRELYAYNLRTGWKCLCSYREVAVPLDRIPLFLAALRQWSRRG